jgi:Kef-type K+ transport system membrane component KefB
LFQALGQTDPPLYAIFFVIAGADLNVSLIGSMGTMGLVYVIARGIGKVCGATFGSRLAKLPTAVQSFAGWSLMAHAGLAVGLSIAINRRFPELAPAVVTVVLSAVVIYEIIGPLGVRLALVRSGEAATAPSAPVSSLEDL